MLRRKIVFPRKKPPIGDPIPNGHPLNHIHIGNIIWIEQVEYVHCVPLCVCVCAPTHTCTHSNNKQVRGHEFEREKWEKGHGRSLRVGKQGRNNAMIF